MEKLEMLWDYIEDELADAKKYIEQALKCREKDKALAELFYKLSEEEMKHMSLLKEQLPGDSSELMGFVNRKQMESAVVVRTMQAMYKSPVGI